jgi:hypothetical protein
MNRAMRVDSDFTFISNLYTEQSYTISLKISEINYIKKCKAIEATDRTLVNFSGQKICHQKSFQQCQHMYMNDISKTN